MEGIGIVATIGWLAAWIVASILYRRRSARPLFPRAPDNAVFVEAWRSGRSLKNVLTRLGGARNCLLVYVADAALTIVPIFPFNLMFLPEIYELETTVPVSDVRVASLNGLFGKRLLLTIEGPREQRFELWLSDQQGFRDALEGEPAVPSNSAQSKPSARPRAGLRLNLFRVFALVWGLGAGTAGLVGLTHDIRFWALGTVATGRIVGHTGEIGARNDTGVVQFEADGRPYTLTSIRGAGIYKIGDVEKVRYMPDNPASAREEDYMAFDLLFVLLGCCMLILALTIGRIARIFTRGVNA